MVQVQDLLIPDKNYIKSSFLDRLSGMDKAFAFEDFQAFVNHQAMQP